MQILFHTCGQALDVAEKLVGRFATNEFVFLDPQTGDGYDRCPRCDRDLRIEDFTVQPPRIVSRAKRAPVSPATWQARALVRKAREITSRRVVA